MDPRLAGLFIAFIAIYLATLGGYHLMVFKVNRQLPQSRRIPHTLYWGGWHRLREEYQGLYPRSALYRMTVNGALLCLLVALAIVAVSTWEYFR